MLRHKLVRPNEIKVLDAERGLIEVLVSDESPDRDDDIIRQGYWDLKPFQAHPVLIAGHDYHYLQAQIGEWSGMEVRGRKLVGSPEYYVGQGNKDADWGFNLAMRGKAAYSVGFIPDMDKARPRDESGHGLMGMFPSYEFRGQTLLEVSHVVIPANPHALQLMQRAKGLHPEIDTIVGELIADCDTNGIAANQANLDDVDRVVEVLQRGLNLPDGQVLEDRLLGIEAAIDNLTADRLATMPQDMEDAEVTEEEKRSIEQQHEALGTAVKAGIKDALREVIAHGKH